MIIHESFQQVVQAIKTASDGDTIYCSSEQLRRRALRYSQFLRKPLTIKSRKLNAKLNLVHSNNGLYEGVTRKSKASLKVVN
ncbi:MAG: hypothetical protein R3D26_18640 [Cyanobacteriota/Melainabacteria group bacterium]